VGSTGNAVHQQDFSCAPHRMGAVQREHNVCIISLNLYVFAWFRIEVIANYLLMFL
jgi:hypothetical protein